MAEELSGKKKAAVVIGILAAAGLGVYLLISSRSQPEPQEPPPSSPLVQTEPVRIRSGAIAVEAAGTVRPRAEVGVAPQVSGKVVSVNPALKTGGVVRRGETLFRIEQADFRNAVEQARADVAQQEVSVLRAEEEVRLAREEFETFQELEAERNDVTVVDEDDYAARFVPPGGLRTDARRGVGAGEPSPLLFREPQLRAAEAALQRAQARLEDARLQLSRTTVAAPFTGVVRSESVDIGSTVAPGQSVVTLYAADALEVVVPLSDEQAALIPTLFSSAGRAPVLVTTVYGGTTFGWRGYVDRAEQAVDPETRTIDAVVRVPEPLTGARPVDVGRREAELGDGTDFVASGAPPLLVGEFVEVQIDGVELERYAVVPRRALQRGDRVFAVEQDSLLAIVPVTVIQRVGEEVLVRGEGLREGQPVIVSGVEAPVDGMTVRLASRVDRGGGESSSGEQTSARAGRQPRPVAEAGPVPPPASRLQSAATKDLSAGRPGRRHRHFRPAHRVEVLRPAQDDAVVRRRTTAPRPA